MPDGVASLQPTVLESVKVVDWTDQSGAYAGRLLADLGADVVRIETSPQQDPWPEEAMAAAEAGRASSGLERYVNLNKRSVRLDTSTPAGQQVLAELLAQADVVITAGDACQQWYQEHEKGNGASSTAVHVSVSPFGQSADGVRLAADDLVTLAAGGLLSLGGYPDSEPIAVYGHQAYLAGGINAAVGAMLGLLAVDAGQPGADVDVSVQAVMASALEDAAAEFDLTGVVRRRTGDGLREAGTGTFTCADGWIVVVAGKLGTAEAWDSLVSWLCEQELPGAEVLKAPEWSTLEYRRRPESIAAFQQIMESATARYTRQELYAELQGRRVAVAPVNSIADLLAEPQLSDREFFRHVTDDWLGREVIYPGPPYRLTEHATRAWTAAPAPGQDTEHVLRDWLGADDERVAALRNDGVIE